MLEKITTPRKPLFLIASLLLAWLFFLSIQALVRPCDGYKPDHMLEHVTAFFTGPLLGRGVLFFLHSNCLMHVWRILYALLLLLVPLFATRVMASLIREESDDRTQRRMQCFLMVAAVALMALTIWDFPYLSNDIYLYRTQGQMLCQEGVSPYQASPSEVFSYTQLKSVPWTTQKSPYGPLALAGFMVATTSPGDINLDFIRLKIMAALPLLILLVMVIASRRLTLKEKSFGLAWIGLNPLVLLEISQNAHLEGWIALLLALLMVALHDVSKKRVLLGGLLLGLACAIKLTLLVACPIALAWLWAQRRRQPFSKTLGHALLFVAALILTVAVVYLPFWQGAQTFTGIQQEATKISRSLYASLGYHFGMSVKCISGLCLLGNLATVVTGMLICIRSRSLPRGLISCLIIQSIIGRTFVQAWYFCPALLLIPFLGMASIPTPERRDAGGSILDDPLHQRMLRALLVLSGTMLAGAYATMIIGQSYDIRGDRMQTISFFCMMLPFLIAWWRAPKAARVKIAAA